MALVDQIIPIFKVSDMTAALALYCEQLGFERLSLYQAQPDHPSYAILARDGCHLHLSTFPGDGTPDSVAYIQVTDIDALRRELIDRGLDESKVEILDQTWGAREIYLSDGDGNRLRFGSRS